MGGEITPRTASAFLLGEPLVRIDATARINAVRVEEAVVPVQRQKQLYAKSQRPADESRIDEILHVPDRRNPAELGIDDSDPARRELRVAHLIRLEHIDGEWQSIIDVFAGAKSSHHHGMPKSRPGTDVDDVEIRIGDQVGDIPVGTRHSKSLGRRFRGFTMRGANRRDLLSATLSPP